MAITINGTTGLAGVDGSASTPAVQGGDSNTGVFFPAADTVAIATGGTEAMRVNSSQNVGIGTSSPTFASGGGLQVKNAGFTSVRVTSSSSTGIDFAQDTSANGYMYNRDNAALIFGTNNTEQARITAAGLLQFNSGYGSVATAYGCRAWVNFNGTGTVAIRASGNVSSITDNGVGDYTVNFTTAMPDANYSFSFAGFLSSGSSTNAVVVRGDATAAAGSLRARITTVNLTSLVDWDVLDFAFFR